MAKVRIDYKRVLEVHRILVKVIGQPHRAFMNLGITRAQWNRFLQTKKLKVRPAVRDKVEFLEKFTHPGADLSNIPTILKMLEAREGKQK